MSKKVEKEQGRLASSYIFHDELEIAKLKAQNLRLIECLQKYESCICDDGETYAAREVLAEMGIE